MTFTERHIIESYGAMLDNLSDSGKLELIDSLNKSIGSEHRDEKSEKFFASFGGFVSDDSAEDIIIDLKNSRVFNKKNLNF